MEQKAKPIYSWLELNERLHCSNLEVDGGSDVSMGFFLWIVAGVLAAVFPLSGMMKISRPPHQPAASGLGWPKTSVPDLLSSSVPSNCSWAPAA
ncbi:hypothetical protein [Streptomyces sp. NPDC058457]|uniref:hypothetical protein n=1 Tax=Streptomyces sp. NPDC058457 TaxID=3346507 RepID=UPI00365BCD0A